LLAVEDLLPSCDIPLDPERGLGMRLGRHRRVIGKRLEQGVSAAVSAAPGRLSRAARTLDHDDHLAGSAPSPRARTSARSGSAVAIPRAPATANGPTHPA